MSKTNIKPDALMRGVTNYKGFGIINLTVLKCHDNKPRDVFMVFRPDGKPLGDGFSSLDDCRAAITTEASHQ